jgi:hypothetical protein
VKLSGPGSADVLVEPTRAAPRRSPLPPRFPFKAGVTETPVGSGTVIQNRSRLCDPRYLHGRAADAGYHRCEHRCHLARRKSTPERHLRVTKQMHQPP